jgi:hypothetical protein
MEPEAHRVGGEGRARQPRPFYRVLAVFCVLLTCPALIIEGDDALSRSQLTPPCVRLVAIQPVTQRDRARHRPRCKAFRDNRCILRRAPASPPRRSRQNLHLAETVPINWQITWQTSLPASPVRDRIIRSPSPPARRGLRSAYASPDWRLPSPVR